jgi:hypothetical protein
VLYRVETKEQPYTFSTAIIRAPIKAQHLGMSISSTDHNVELGEIQSSKVKLPSVDNKGAAMISVTHNVEQNIGLSSLAERTKIPINEKISIIYWCHRVFCRRYMRTASCTLLLSRLLAVVWGLACVGFETVAFKNSRGAEQEFRAVRFMFGGNYIYYEVAAMIYASGAAAFGTTVDFVPGISLSVINCILAHINCQNPTRAKESIFSMIRVSVIYLLVELCYRNFQKLPRYKESYREAANVMLRQTLLFCFTALFRAAPGMRTVYRNTIRTIPDCNYSKNQCGLLELYEPQFKEGHPCEDGFTQYITSREELRIIRNFVYINIAFYAMFNNMFLEVTNNMEVYRLRVLLIFLFALLSTSVVYSNVTPFGFLGGPKIFYDIIEAVFFLLLLILLGYQWYRKGSRRHLNTNLRNPQTNESVERMKENPVLLHL